MTTSSGITRREALRRGLTVGGAALVWTAPSAQAFAMTTANGQAGSLNYGCTPGFWKTHLDAWCPGVETGDPLSQYFSELTGSCIDIPDVSLLEALDWPDTDPSNTLEGAAKILLRQAVALLLNICSFYYGSNQSDVTGPVDALLSCDPEPPLRSALLKLKDDFQILNERECPWSGKEPYVP